MKTLALFLFFYSQLLAAYDVPTLTGPVVDQVGVLKPQEFANLTSFLRSINDQGKAQIQILILDSLNNETIESVSIQVASKWKLGDEKKDNGILFLIAIKDRKMRFEIGQGFEGDIPDLAARRILDSRVQPQFKAGQYYSGIMNGVREVLKRVSGPKDNDDEDNNEDGNKKNKKDGSWLIFVYIILFIIFSLMRGSRRSFGRRGIWTGGGGFGGWGGGGGGGWSGGGGGFSGGGSSSDW